VNVRSDTRIPVEKMYTRDVMHRAGLRIWLLMMHELWASRGLLRVFAGRNISVKYRQSVLSYLWVVIPPVFAVVLFSYLINQRVINVGATPVPYLSYALLNISIWLLFSNTLMAATKSLVEAGTLITRVNFPKVTLVFASISDAILEFLIRLMAVAVVFYLQEVIPGWQVFWIPVLLLPVILLALGLGLFLSILNLVVRDTANILGIVLTLAMFLTPVLYPPPVAEPFVYLNLFNPISPVLNNIHGIIASGTLTESRPLVAAILSSLTVFLAGWRIFNLTMPRISERA